MAQKNLAEDCIKGSSIPLEQQTIPSALILSPRLEFSWISRQLTPAELCQRGSHKTGTSDLTNRLAKRESEGERTSLTRAGAFPWEGWSCGRMDGRARGEPPCSGSRAEHEGRHQKPLSFSPDQPDKGNNYI